MMTLHLGIHIDFSPPFDILPLWAVFGLQKGIAGGSAGDAMPYELRIQAVTGETETETEETEFSQDPDPDPDPDPGAIPEVEVALASAPLSVSVVMQNSMSLDMTVRPRVAVSEV